MELLSTIVILAVVFIFVVAFISDVHDVSHSSRQMKKHK